MTKNNSILTLNRNGELIDNGLNSHIKMRYKSDTPLDNSVVPYIIMLICATVDTVVFLSLFKLLSFDSPLMLGVQVTGLLFAFDIVPIYLGIQLRRMKQNLSEDKVIFYLALGVCAVALIVNIILNIMTIDLMNPDVSSTTTSYFGTVTEDVATKELDPATIALTIFRITCPILTSVGSFFISFLTYNPLKIRKRTAEEVLFNKIDETRRLKAILHEYDAYSNSENILRINDEGKYEEMQKMHRAKAINYCEYVRLRFKEYLANPTSNNALSEETCIAILKRLDQELATLNNTCNTDTIQNTTPMANVNITDDVAA